MRAGGGVGFVRATQPIRELRNTSLARVSVVQRRRGRRVSPRSHTRKNAADSSWRSPTCPVVCQPSKREHSANGKDTLWIGARGRTLAVAEFGGCRRRNDRKGQDHGDVPCSRWRTGGRPVRDLYLAWWRRAGDDRRRGEWPSGVSHLVGLRRTAGSVGPPTPPYAGGSRAGGGLGSGRASGRLRRRLGLEPRHHAAELAAGDLQRVVVVGGVEPLEVLHAAGVLGPEVPGERAVLDLG